MPFQAYDVIHLLVTLGKSFHIHLLRFRFISVDISAHCSQHTINNRETGAINTGCFVQSLNVLLDETIFSNTVNKDERMSLQDNKSYGLEGNDFSGRLNMHWRLSQGHLKAELTSILAPVTNRIDCIDCPCVLHLRPSCHHEHDRQQMPVQSATGKHC